MKPIDVKFQAALIRQIRGMLNAWEEWMFVQSDKGKVEENADPRKHIQEMNSKTRRDATPHR